MIETLWVAAGAAVGAPLRWWTGQMLRERWGATATAGTLAVNVVGSFVLADSMRNGFDTLFSAAFEKTDLEVRTALAFGEGSDTATRDPVDASLLETISDVPGVANASGDYQRNAQIIGNDGDAVTTNGAPMFGGSWDGTDAEAVDTCMRLGAGHPMGPLALLDLVGLDVSAAIGRTIDVEVPARIDALIAEGALGRKTGRGFHSY